MTIGANIFARSQLAQTTICLCVEIIQRLPDGTDGAALRFTGHTQNLTLDGNSYLVSGALMPSQLQQVQGLTPDNAQATIVLGGTWTAAAIRAGKWAGARWTAQWVDYNFPAYGPLVKKTGFIGANELHRYHSVAEFRSLSQMLEQPIGEAYSKDCRVVELGDSRCGVDVNGSTVDTAEHITQTGTVASVTDRQVFTGGTWGAGVPSDGLYDRGTLEWLTGDNAPAKVRVYLNVGAIITLFTPQYSAIVVGDTFSIVAGCNRSRTECRTKFNNVSNFRGEPDLCGRARLLVFPDA